MLRTSLPFGRVLGVDLRIHATFPLLLALSVGYSLYLGENVMRGIGLWTALCFAVLVRESARSIAAAYAGLHLRALFLLPVGGIMAFAPRDRHAPAADTRLVTASGPVANLAIGLLLLGTSYVLDPHVALLAQPWVGAGHILRSFVWLQFVLGAVSLLPVPGEPTRNLLRARKLGTPQPIATDSTSARPAIGLGTMMALTMIVAGFALMSLWLVVFGGFMLLGAQLGGSQGMNSPAAESILVREVMLTEYTLLSTSDTLRDALDRTTHSLQDVFPIVRGNRLVGSVARQTIADRLVSEGDGYLQGVMTRSLQLAGPSEKLVDALRRAASLGASEFIPVVDEGAMLGILTPQSLSRAVQQIQLTRPQTAVKERS